MSRPAEFKCSNENCQAWHPPDYDNHGNAKCPECGAKYDFPVAKRYGEEPGDSMKSGYLS